MSTNDNVITFWDNEFKIDKSFENVKVEDFVCKDSLNKELKFMGDNCNTILDYGCGIAYLLCESLIFGNKCSTGIGIDTSLNAINNSKILSKNLKLENTEFILGDESILADFSNESLDGIICSNVLDVIKEEKASKIINQFKRILKPNGYLLIKLNFYITTDLYSKFNHYDETNEFYINGILRDVNLTTDEWINKLKPLKLIRTSGLERVKGLNDRILLLQKLS